MIPLTDAFALFAHGIPIGALLAAFPWVVGLAIDLFIKTIRKG